MKSIKIIIDEPKCIIANNKYFRKTIGRIHGELDVKNIPIIVLKGKKIES